MGGYFSAILFASVLETNSSTVASFHCLPSLVSVTFQRTMAKISKKNSSTLFLIGRVSEIKLVPDCSQSILFL